MKKRVVTIAWMNCVWQMLFGLAWNLGLHHPAEVYFGRVNATLIDGLFTLIPTLIVFLIVMGWARKLGLWP